MTKPQNNLIQHRAGLRWLALILILFCELMAHTWVRTE
ncbi:MAG: cell division protein FtsL, partial [Deltaproteobacteria bacterium]|nr:cell division protein FtsL [Deltaproteobacteria bacterium]